MKKQFIVFGVAIVVIAIAIIAAVIQSKNIQTEVNESTPITIDNQTNLKTIDTLEIFNDNSTGKIITDKLNKIEQIGKNNTYTPAEREWITSGPLQIDRTKYVLGEKVFMRFGGISPTTKGEIVFLRPLNETHYSVYLSIPFDGEQKNAFNLYFEPKLVKDRDICSKEDLIGKWAVVLRGTDYPNLYFNVIDQILPGDEDKFVPVC